MYYTGKLNNGIRIIHRYVDSDVSHCGLIINCGTRDENIHQQGLAHFVEHMLFKGTSKRKAYHVLSRIDDVGGEIDAWTTKEETVIASSFLNEYYERSIELLNDVVFNSTFPQKELEKEREVIIDEINSYKDSPSDMIFDHFDELLFLNHSLGRNTLGTKSSLKKYSTEDLQNFISEKYNTDEMVFCSIGKIKFDKLLKYCEKHFGQNPANFRKYSRSIFENKTVFEKIVKKNTYQAHCIFGTYAYAFTDSKRLALLILSNLLAGSGMNARLSLMLREKKGISYNIEANYIPYEDIGCFNIYFGSEKDKVETALHIIKKELIKLKDVKLGSLQLSKLKKQLVGQIAISNEIHSQVLLSMGKTFLIYNQIETLQETLQEINSITSEQLLEVANDIFDLDKFSTLIYY